MAGDTKFTPGPWTVRKAKKPIDGEFDFGIFAEIGGSPYCIAEAYGRVSPSFTPEARANANLIAASPGLFEAAQAAEAKLTDMCIEKTTADNDPTIVALRAALAKAMGEP
jgi:hypothetical protein